jgi:hypothetical protein
MVRFWLRLGLSLPHHMGVTYFSNPYWRFLGDKDSQSMNMDTRFHLIQRRN